MNNSTNFLGNSVFGQLISLIPNYQVQRAVNKYQSNKYTKRFSIWEHLVSMLFATASNTTSLGNVTNGFLGLEGKLLHLNLKRSPKRIWNLLLTVLQRQIKVKAWAFSNLASVIRLHLFNYINLTSFLKNSEKHYQQIIATELKLFDG